MTAESDAFENLRAFLIKARSERGWSQDEVARRGGFPRGTLSAIEAGRGSIPRQMTMERLAKGLDVPYKVLDLIARGVRPEAAVAMSSDADADDLYQFIQSLPQDKRDLGRRLLWQLADDRGLTPPPFPG